jgi:EAL domain-containing protein (putative c-di-GMP-specific phosphodiesterase class I)
MTDTSRRVFKKGDILMREGERGAHAFVIESGTVEILVEQEGTLIGIGTRGPGSLLGEMALIDNKPRTATVRALGHCEALEISRDDFARRVDTADAVLKMVLHVVLARYRHLLSRTQFLSLPPPDTSAEAQEKHSAAQDAAISAIKIHNELESALQSGQLLLHFQPIIDLKDMKIAGFEALMRWRHPQHGMISPAAFIPIAEESGLIVEMTRLALETSCDAARQLRKAANPEIVTKNPLFVSVNFSVKDFEAGGVFERVQAALKLKNVSPQQIHMEITESLLMDAQDKARESLERCRAFGVGVSLDDFGTGYSSLGYLHRFPIDTIKIDQSFIRSMSQGQKSHALVKAIIAMAKALDMQVIAEGIETEDEALLLRRFGCLQGQGYWFAKPMPLSDALGFVKNWNPPKIS